MLARRIRLTLCARMACNDDEEVLSASASSPEEAAQPKLKKAKKAPSDSRPPAIDVIDVDEQKEHLMSDESQSGSPDIEMTKTGEELRHPRANPSIEFLYATNLSHTFGGAYPRVSAAGDARSYPPSSGFYPYGMIVPSYLLIS